MKYATVKVKGLDVFYRESGAVSRPTFLLLHGFPTASHLFRNLIPMLESHFHVIAPDLIGFGQSAAPNHQDFDYTFANLTDYVDGFLAALQIKQFYLYVFDYGAPIGFNLAVKAPNRILGIVSQNGNVYRSGLGPKWAERQAYWAHPTAALRNQYQAAFAPATIKGQYLGGEQPGSVAPDGYSLDIFYTQAPDYAERQSDLIFDYQNNVSNYPKYQQYLRTYQPELIAAWGKNDPSFIYPGAQAFKRDDSNAEVHLLDGGHFVLESHWQTIGKLILDKWGQR
ncbi:alpha/beta fold hydrolase [Lactiplantibacillus modestisalitolerans]|uniref:Alpha/beta fold hydrolase n=1 Tax=Lactiplantibacillus modestisalitolerans TaxID=1457219 RepID=A0ABV5WY79_9LACO|nr:alpha/beta fold hydrolase [Lactiplantibacillus modestisalitolerans]